VRFGCGCVNLGSASASATWSDQVHLVRTAVDAGVTVFDTADVYGAGSSERILGRALRGRRAEVTISTKGGYSFRPRVRVEQLARRRVAQLAKARGRSNLEVVSAPGTAHQLYASQDFTPRHLRAALEASLRRLKTDFVDVYQLHGPTRLLDDLLAELDDLRQAGTVRQFGVGAESVASAADWAPCLGGGVLQLPFGLLDPEAKELVFPATSVHGVEVWARGVLAGGILSAAIDDIASVAYHPKRHQIEALANIASEAGLRLDELAVRWVRRWPDIAVVLLGMSSIDHLERNLALAAQPALGDDLANEIAAAMSAPPTDHRHRSS
jgi:aryl-alcohol dehydrogenase-like predicted oxidoreductase